ncbi:MAG: quinone-dependent dihydroorotate dehydrogenase [Gammaproteobacteria bacterium]|nr:quinone-dependent dihydroorotate dehydrogenase [Gammaproteobacteria bacterium]
MLYYIFKKIIFLFEPEFSHKLTFKLLNILDKLKVLDLYEIFNKNKFKLDFNPDFNPDRKFNHLKFKNKLGLAAGVDKNGEYILPISKLGFGFIEVGTITPKPQIGNAKPRLFRLKDQEAIINRMGFNNIGIDNLIKNIIKTKNKLSKNNIILGVNIGKNAATPIEKAIDDYLICFEKAYLISDYICINISSPNTQNLRNLQEKEYLNNLLSQITLKRQDLINIHQKHTPIALKIAPDLTFNEIADICDLIIKYKIDIIIATNTTNEDKLLYNKDNMKIMGGLSGRPLCNKSNSILVQVVDYFKSKDYRKNIIIIAVGGIGSVEDAQHKLSLGADLIQLYTGLVYKGPKLARDILTSI